MPLIFLFTQNKSSITAGMEEIIWAIIIVFISRRNHKRNIPTKRKKTRILRRWIRLYFFIFCNPQSMLIIKSKNSWKGIINKAKKRYSFFTPAKRESLKSEILINPKMIVKALIRTENIILLPRICSSEYFFLPIWKIVAELIPRLVKVMSSVGSKIANE